MKQVLHVLQILTVALAAVVSIPQGVFAQETSATAAQGVRTQLAEVTLPDLSTMEGVVADQMRNEHAALLQMLGRAEVSDQQLALGYGLLGQTLHAYDLPEIAEPCYRNARLLDPSSFDWIYLLADVFRLQARLEEAIELYEQARALRPKDAVCLARLGEAHFELNHLDLAKGFFAATLALDPSQIAAGAGLGKVALAERNFEQAVEYLEAALAAAPGANRLHYSLAMAYRGLGNREAGQAHLKKRGKIGLRIADPLVDGLRDRVKGERVSILRGRLAYAAGDFQEAVAAFAEAVAIAPESVTALIDLGSALGMLGNREGAIANYQQALAYDPENVIANLNLGELLHHMNRNEEALPYLVMAKKGAPRSVPIHLLLGVVLRRLNRPSDAIVHYVIAGELDTSSAAAFVGQASILTDIGRYSEALEILESVHQQIPTSGQVAQALSRMLAGCPDIRLRNADRAINLAQRVVAAEPSIHNAATMAMALAEAGRCEEAANLQQQILTKSLASGIPAERIAIMRAELAHYRAGPPCRPPATED